MGEFFVHREAFASQLWLYSERGLVSYLVHHLLLRDHEPVLRAATNGRPTLWDATEAPFLRHASFGEFNLGSRGFGSPDGGFLGELRNDGRAFVFIEAKAVLEDDSYQVPADVISRIASVDFETVEEGVLENLIKKNSFNSSINGQIEMRWRFVNALLKGPTGSEMKVSEQRLAPLPDDLLRTDLFYWRRRLLPDPSIPEDWRSVNMGHSQETNLLPLCEMLRVPNTRFFLLAITADRTMPAGLHTARLFTAPSGQPVNAQDFVYWLPLQFIIDKLERP